MSRERPFDVCRLHKDKKQISVKKTLSKSRKIWYNIAQKNEWQSVMRLSVRFYINLR